MTTFLTIAVSVLCTLGAVIVGVAVARCIEWKKP